MVFRLQRTLLLGVLMTASAGLKAADSLVNIASVEEYAKHFQGDKPMIAMFTASWCGPCKQTKPHYLELATAYNDITFCIIDIDNKDLKPIHSEIKGVPTFVLSHKGQVVTKKSGGMARAQLQDMIENFKADVSGQKRAPAKSAPALAIKEYHKMGQEQYRKVVATCEQKEFDNVAIEALLMDPANMELAQVLASAEAGSEVQKKAFENMKAYMRGAKSALEGYKPQGKNPQDAFIKYSISSIDMALSSPDYVAYMTRQAKVMEIFQKKMKLLMWEIFADIDYSSL